MTIELTLSRFQHKVNNKFQQFYFSDFILRLAGFAFGRIKRESRESRELSP